MVRLRQCKHYTVRKNFRDISFDALESDSPAEAQDLTLIQTLWKISTGCLWRVSKHFWYLFCCCFSLWQVLNKHWFQQFSGFQKCHSPLPIHSCISSVSCTIFFAVCDEMFSRFFANPSTCSFSLINNVLRAPSCVFNLASNSKRSWLQTFYDVTYLANLESYRTDVELGSLVTQASVCRLLHGTALASDTSFNESFFRIRHSHFKSTSIIYFNLLPEAEDTSATLSDLATFDFFVWSCCEILQVITATDDVSFKSHGHVDATIAEIMLWKPPDSIQQHQDE